MRQALREFDLALQNVSLIQFSSQNVPVVQFTRLNQRYRPAIMLARLILRATSFDLGSGAVAASEFLVDMNSVFEDFVTAALGEALGKKGLRLESQDDRLRLDLGNRIRLVPDLAVWQAGRCLFVGDVKYKRTEWNRGRNPDLYQLLAYTVAADLPNGVLLYAKGEEHPGRHSIRHAGKELRVEALDLEAPPESLLQQIGSIAQTVLAEVRRSEVIAAPTA
jgi:5-methylcytosine-specific restriction enzyme subunit McrC